MQTTGLMRGCWLHQQKLTYRQDLPLPEQKPNQAIIKVLLAGICGTDLQLLRGYYEFSGIPGHEFVGEVVTAPDAEYLVGKRVVGEINIACGHCDICQAVVTHSDLKEQSLQKHCLNRKVLGIKNHNGAFAEYLTLPVENLHVVPEDIANETAVFTEPLAAAAQILRQVPITASTQVLIIGAGRLGLLIAQVVKTTRCPLQVVARHEKAKHILQHCGIESISEAQIPHQAMDVVIEATGSPMGLNAAMQAVRPAGSIVLKSTYSGEAAIDFSRLVVNEVRLIGSRCGPFEPALELLQCRAVDPTLLIEAVYSFKDIKKALQHAKKQGTLKVLLRPE